MEEAIQSCDSLWSEQYEQNVISILQQGLTGIKGKREQYHFLNSFRLVTFGDVQKVVRCSTGKYMATKNATLGIIKQAHHDTGHGGERKTHQKIIERYANVPRHLVGLFLRGCERCAEKKHRKETAAGVTVKPLTVKKFNERGQVDLIDMQTVQDGEYRYILNYMEYLTKFHILRPLQSKQTAEVARNLLFIFLDFGAPLILQSDNGREFTSQLIRELSSLWPDLVLINGRPRHPQSQGSIERSNAGVKSKLAAWMRDNKTPKWTFGVRFVQWQLNSSYHEAIKMSPYQAFFGNSPRCGLKSELPEEFLARLSAGMTEEDFEQLVPGLPNESSVEEDDDDDDHPAVQAREAAVKSLHLQAKRMLARGSKVLTQLVVGDNVAIPVPEVDRGKADPPNVIGVVLDFDTDTGCYTIGTKEGTVRNKLARNQFESIPYKGLSTLDVPEKQLSLREIVRAQSVASGQGYRRCLCTQSCGTKRCSCLRAGLRCNSACHSGSKLCTNV